MLLPRCALPPGDPQYDVAVVLPRSAHRAEPVDPDLIQPDGALAPFVVTGDRFAARKKSQGTSMLDKSEGG